MKPAGLYSVETFREPEVIMPTTSYVLGIDIGTSGARVLLVNQDTGEVERSTRRGYPCDTPRPGWSEQAPEDWWMACCEAIKQLMIDSDIDGSLIGAIGLTGQMHGLVALDEHDAVIRPSIIWNDQRTQAQCDRIHETIGRERLIEITGKPAMTGFTAPKILWMRDHEPELYDKIRHVLLPKDFILLRLTGTHSIDASDASGTSLLDLKSRDWSDPLLEKLQIEKSWMPPVSESQKVVAVVNAEASTLTGLHPGTPVVAGAGDQAAGGIGCGIDDESSVSINLGTSGVVFAGRRTPPHDPTGSLHGYCHAIEDTWHVMGVMLSAGGSLEWFRNTLAQDRTFDQIVKEATAVEPGCEGLRFLPYLTGERTPHVAPDARGSFTGISTAHGHPHFCRSVLEGVMFGLKDGLDLIRDTNRNIDHVRITGGGSRSRPWRQMAADIFDLPVATVNVSDGSAYGAALLAMTGIGRFPDVSESMRAFVKTDEMLQPTSTSKIYASIHAQWRGLFGILEPTFDRR